MLLTNRNRGVTIDSDTSFALRGSMLRQVRILFSVWVATLVGASGARAQIELTGTTPSAGQAVNTSSPDLLLDFSGALNVATATTDTIRIYRLGADEVTPATDDTQVPISAISPENGGARLRVTTVNPLPDGDYAWVVYGSASDRSGPGASLHFDGNLATLNLAAFQTLGMNFTWEAWINLECCTSYGGHGFGAIFDVGQNGRNVPGVVLQHNQAAWNFHCYRPDGTESQAIAGDSVVLGAWQHIACSASATGVRLYIDGELAASTPDVCDISAMQSFFNTAISGYTRWAGAYDYILGSIDEMRVWNVARTQAQIRAGMHTPLAGNEAGLLVYYPLDEGAGNSLIDMSQNNYLGGRGSAQWEVSEAPLILMASTVLLGDDEIAVDTNGDALPGGVLVSPFRVDTTSPRVVDLTPALDECPVILYPGSILVQFDDDMDPNSLVPANMALTSAGPDGVIGNADDIAVPYSSLYSEPMRALSILPLSPMTDDAYRLALSDAVVNTSGFSLDGDYPGTIGGGDPLPTGDGLPGGAFVLTFRVNTIDDCNFDGVPDACELVNNDFNVNGVPDECEDCNGNGIADECDISCEAGDGGCNIAGCGLSADCNTNLIPDECEILEGLAGLSPVVRSPINGHHYYLAPTTTWASAKTLAESLGGQLVTIRSAEENQWLVDTFAPLTTATQAHIGFTDAASEGVWVWLSAEPVTFTSWGSGEPNDIGTEDNAIIALQAEGVYVPGDWNDVPASTPRPAIIELSGDADCNQNGVLDECDIASGTSEDCNENDVPDDCEPGGLGDCDDDGVSDLCEFYLGTALDCNDDNIPDACQLDGADCNGNGVPDDCEPDCDGNNVPDDCDLDPLDPDGDGLVGVDCDGNGRPDECDGQLANRALAFDGNDLVTIPQDLVHSRTTLTFEAWFRTSASGVIFGYQNQPFPTAPSNYTPAVYVGTDGLLRGEFYMGSAASIITSASAVDDNQWHHVALAANVNTQRMYLDGQLVGVLAGTINQLNMTHNQIGMGHSASNNWDGLGAGWMGFVGEIDDVRLWSSYRSQQQIVDNMLSIFEPSPSDLLGRWRFNEGYGQTAFDASGMANDGTLGVSGSIEFSDPTWLLSDTGEVLDDCNDNGVLDACDISSGVSIDCNENGVPDECEPGGQSDCDGDGTSDLCEFHLGAGVDCDNNGVPDACELSDGDCNHNDVLDICEVQVANYALDFEQVNDLVRVPDSPDLRPVDELTVEAWIRPDSAGSTHSRIVRHAPFNGAGYILSFQQNSNARIQFRIGNGSLGSAFPTDTVPTSTYFGSWHHVAGVYSASGNFVRVFVDGVLKDEVAAVGPLGLSVSDLSIGNYLSGGERFDGLIDDVRIWNIARSRDQLVDTMFRPLMGNEPGLVGCWRFNEGVGQQVFDASPYHNNGFLGNDDLPVGDDRDPAWSTIASPIPVTDCNENGVLDACDFANGTSLDCNENGTPDDCEPGGRGDCDGNGVSDLCEIYLENSGDCNANAIPDLCELVDNDCNANGIPDDCEVTNNDCNANGVPDDCDIAEGAEDCNENGILDVCELVADNQSLELDGVNDYIQMPNDVWFDGDFTVEAWVNVHQVGYWTRLLDFSNGTPNNNVIIALSDANSGKPTLQVVSGTGSGPPKVTSSVAISLNQWTHMAFVVRGTTGEIYMNGGLVGSGSLYAPLNVVRTRNYIGRSPWSSDAYAKIAVDELRIWNVARTQSEISWNMNLSPSGQSPGLVGYWKFDDGAGQFAADQSSMMRAGVLGGTDAVESADPVWTVGGAVADNDCNGTGGLDECEISDESSADCNVNGVPDECEPGGADDCDANGVSDLCDLYEGMADDCNNNAILDTCELVGNDCNANGIPDDCELANNDCDANGVPDECDIASGAEDCNSNGIPDSCELSETRGSLDFDGVNDFVRVASTPILQPSSELTVEAWIKADSVASRWSRIVFGGRTASTGGFMLAMQQDNDRRVQFQLKGAGARLDVKDNIDAGDYVGDWAHVAGVYSVSGDFARLYIDGVLIQELPDVGPLNYAAEDFLIGTDADFSQSFFDGHIDEVRVWNVALSESQIQDNMYAHLTGNETGLVGYWRFDEQNGQVALDHSSNLLHGRLGSNSDSQGDTNDPLRDDMNPPIPLADCNNNSELDACEIAAGTSIDCNENGVPDECEPGGLEDCDGNGVSDLCDLFAGTYADCNANAIPDACELIDNDCNANGVPDECELVGNDCNGNDVPDDCEIAAGAADCNENGVPDSCELQSANYALDFDGAGDLVRIPRSSVLEPSDELTVEAWIRPDSAGALHSRIVRSAGSFGSGFILSWQQGGNGRLQLRIDNATLGSVQATDTAPTSTYFGAWHHVAGVYSATGNYVRLYVDGQLRHEVPAVGPLLYSGSDIGIGNYLNASNESFDGQIDEVRIWSVARTQSQLVDAMQRPLVGNETGLAGYWGFDEGQGQQVTDGSANGNHGWLGTNAAASDSSDPIWVNSTAPIPVNDCNLNGALDECDIADGTSNDCNQNGAPDECEVDEDCDGNGLQDICDIAAGAADCNNDLVPDACQLSGADCNMNGVLDTCEPGGATDCNGNGNADLCDFVNGVALDCNGNGTPDECDIAMGASSDVDGNGVPDECETEVRVMPVATLINPALTSETRMELPESINIVHEGSRYYLEVWVSDVGAVTQGISGVYVDVAFCGTTVATEVRHGGEFDFLPEGTIQAGKVDEFGAATFDSGVAVAPEWVRVGWIEMRPGEGSPCVIELQPSQNGIGAPGPVSWAFVDLGLLELQVEATTVTYDLNGDGFIGFGDFALFLGSWLQTVPPANPAHDFDCDGIVGPGDLSWFATGWQKDVDDPTILYPVCDEDRGGGPSPGEVDLDVTLLALSSPSSSDTATALPTSLESVGLGETYYIELWASDVGNVNSGLTSAYVDVAYRAPATAVEAVSVSDAWTVLTSGQVDTPGVVSDIGGSILEEGVSIEPEWTRLGVIEVVASGPAPFASFDVLPSDASSAAYARGLIPWSAVLTHNVRVTQGVPGDIDGDNDVDAVDVTLFVNTLMAKDGAGDLNQDGAINGLDIPGFIDGFIDGEFDGSDLASFVSELLDGNTQIRNPAHAIAADMNGDGIVDGADLQAFTLAILGQ